MKHTPGPWEAQILENSAPYITARRHGDEIGHDVIGSANPQLAQAAANARLIAAAPELVEALKNAEIFLEMFLDERWEGDARLAERDGYGEDYVSLHTRNVEESLTAVRAAISKAESLPKESHD